MSSPTSIELADRLNADCHCVSLDRKGLEAELERVSPGFHDEVMAGRPHLFSDSVAFVSAEHVQRMARLVAAVEQHNVQRRLVLQAAGEQSHLKRDGEHGTPS